MKKILIGIIFLVSSLSENASKEIDLEDYYSFVDQIDDMTFTIESPQINKLVKQKLILDKEPNLKATVYYLKDKLAIKFAELQKISESVVERVEMSFLKKAKIITGADFLPWVKEYQKVKSAKNTLKHHYEDPTGLLDRSEITIIQKPKKLIVTEIYPTGKVVSEYFYTSPVWSQNKKVISKIVRTSDTDNKRQTSITSLSYSKLENRMWMPSKISISTTQVLNPTDDDKIVRNINEEFLFDNYKISQQGAEKFFSEQK